MIKKIRSFYRLNKKYLGSLPRSLYYNLKILPFKQALRIPIFISKNVKVNVKKGRVIFHNCKISTGLIKFGFSNSEFFYSDHYGSVIHIADGYLYFNGSAIFGSGTKLSVDNGAILEFGKNFWSTGDSLIISRKKITFKDNVVLSWGITIMDHDAHNVYNKEGIIINEKSSIFIDEHTWIGCNSIILKGSYLSKGSIIGANSVLANFKADTDFTAFAGSPAKKIKENVYW